VRRIWRGFEVRENSSTDGDGFVIRLVVRKGLIHNYEIQVGGRAIFEYWIPAQDLTELNANFVGQIEPVEELDDADGPLRDVDR
jgi:hypothetical protein